FGRSPGDSRRRFARYAKTHRHTPAAGALDRGGPIGYRGPPIVCDIPGGACAMSRCAWLTAAGGPGGLTGCRERRFGITSDPPGAIVYHNGNPIGATPVDGQFTYYGTQSFTLVRDGHETVTVKERLSPPWYQYFPIDFLAENVWPFHIE